MLVLWREEHRRTRATATASNRLNQHMMPVPGFEPEPYLWELCALTTALKIHRHGQNNVGYCAQPSDWLKNLIISETMIRVIIS